MRHRKAVPTRILNSRRLSHLGGGKRSFGAIAIKNNRSNKGG